VSWRRLAWLGSLLLLAALLSPVIAHGQRRVSDSDLEEVSDWVMNGALLMLVVAAALMILEKAGLTVSGERCRDCKKRIPHGKLYCRDHFQARVDAAKAKYHGQRGLGI
jgi:hypothetical protein